MRYEPGVDVLADHSALLAIPAFAPAFAIVGVVVYIAMRDRRAERSESPEARAEEEER
ncbi:hypothetical protein ACWDYH_09100 [Nocardia goodfellowii]|uniref:Uncharacterized protein n=1 Tax=Nocardia goodfellowii TaxID=882446 RepID=A0ABS4QDH1_9NOCA|nr:hypothetical protein [Nocardia goodfellowii]MBP2189742.1 hypothetical protein [Nocardia goodfellowii]